jgi:hypothetical protein
MIDEHLLSGSILLPENYIEFAGPSAIALTEPAVLKPFGIPLCANNAETPYPCYISVEGRDEKEDGKRSNGC